MTEGWLVDSHCHIDMPQFDADRDAVVERARAAGVARMMLIGGFDEHGGQRRALRVAEELRAPVTAGVHPHEARLWTAAIDDELRGLAREGRIVALGEIGLDFHYDHSPRETQRAVFRRQIHLAREVGLPVIVHTREADDETAAVLEEEGAAEVGGVIHCFTGGHELARRALALGLLVSFSGIVAFPRAEVIQDVARTLPLDRLLIETDAPFLSPPPHRGKRNEPAFVAEVARKLAQLRTEMGSSLALR
jgi:TatD DNase family protein